MIYNTCFFKTLSCAFNTLIISRITMLKIILILFFIATVIFRVAILYSPTPLVLLVQNYIKLYMAGSHEVQECFSMFVTLFTCAYKDIHAPKGYAYLMSIKSLVKRHKNELGRSLINGNLPLGIY